MLCKFCVTSIYVRYTSIYGVTHNERDTWCVVVDADKAHAAKRVPWISNKKKKHAL